MFASWILTSCDVDVFHAELLAVVGVGCARQGQQQHVDEGSVALTCSGGDARLVVVPNLIFFFDYYFWRKRKMKCELITFLELFGVFIMLVNSA